MSQNNRESGDTGHIIRLYDLLKLSGPAQLVTIVDDWNGLDDPIYHGNIIKLLRSEDPKQKDALTREVKHYNTVDDDRKITLGKGSDVVAAIMGDHIDLRTDSSQRRGIVVHIY